MIPTAQLHVLDQSPTATCWREPPWVGGYRIEAFRGAGVWPRVIGRGWTEGDAWDDAERGLAVAPEGGTR